MLTFIGTKDLQAHLAQRGVAAVVADMARLLAEDFGRWAEFDKAARLASHTSLGVIELMPISDGRRYAFKYVNGHPRNPAAGLLTVVAFGVLADVQTGYPLLLAELTLTTALRTAATSALAAQHLARRGSRSMALIGNGAQSEFQAIAFHHLLGIDELRLYDVDPQATDKLVRNLRDYPGLRTVRAGSVAEAVRGADIVTTLTADKSRAHILTPEMLEPGMHINAVGGDCPGKTELHPDVLRRGKLVVEYEPQARVEGDLQQMPADHPVTELWQVLNGQTLVRTDASDVTIFDSVGFALEDYSALRYLKQYVVRPDSRQLDLIPELADPKDLYGMALGRKDSGPALQLIGAPTDMGANVRGAAWGPDALRLAGVAQALAGSQRRVIDHGNLSGPATPGLAADTGWRHLDEVSAWCGAVHGAVAQALRDEHVPVLLGGDHSLAIGSISAVVQHCRAVGKSLRVLWFDAHADCNTADTSPSGNLHGMPVACLLGHGPAALTQLSGATALRPSELKLIGVRSIDAAERALVQDLGFEVLDMRYIAEVGLHAAMTLALAGVDEHTHLHVSLDIDCLSPDIAPGVDTPEPGGLDQHDMQTALQMIAATGRLGSADVVEFNPLRDVHGQTAALVVDLLAQLFTAQTSRPGPAAAHLNS